MTGQAIQSHDVLASEIGVNFSYGIAVGCCPALEHWDRAEVRNALCDVPGSVGAAHDGLNRPGWNIDNEPANALNEIRQSPAPHTQFGYLHGTHGILKSASHHAPVTEPFFGAKIKYLACELGADYRTAASNNRNHVLAFDASMFSKSSLSGERRDAA